MTTPFTDRLLDGEEPSGFQRLLGYRLAEWSENYAVLELEIDQRHTNRAGLIHGGVVATLIDSSCGFAATWCPHEGRVRRVVTLSLTTSFTGQSRTGLIRAVARKKAGGTRIVFCASEIFDARGRMIAMGEGTFRYRTGSEAPEGVPL